MERFDQKTCSELTKLTKKVYPNVTIKHTDIELSIKGAPSGGVVVGDGVIQELSSFQKGTKSVFVNENVPNTVLGHIESLAAIVTTHEDASSHLSIVCRSNGIPVVLVTKDNLIKLQSLDPSKKVSVDTFSQKVTVGKIDVDSSSVITAKKDLLKKVSDLLQIDIAANADTKTEINAAVERGFEHFWPRTETMLYEGDALLYFNALLLDPSNKTITREFQRRHRDSIKNLFFAAKGGRVGFRLLDPPSHEFLPDTKDEAGVCALAKVLETSPQNVRDRIQLAQEQNPMIGHRGARLLLTHDTILDCQIKSSLEALSEMPPEDRPRYLDVLVPFIMHPKELEIVKKRVDHFVKQDEKYKFIPIRVGAMIEVPSILAYPDEIAKNADFIAYGTNDLVALTHGISRGDAYGRYLTEYVEKGVFENDPFLVLPKGIEKNIFNFSKRVKEVNPKISTDMCGEQAVTTDILPLLKDGTLDSVSIGMERLAAFTQNLLTRYGVEGIEAKPHKPSGANSRKAGMQNELGMT